MGGLLVLGAGYLGAALAARALDAGMEVTLADNWSATDEAQVGPLAARGARVVTADIRFPHDVDMLLAGAPDRIVLLAAQASRPLADADPEYTEQTNCTGVRHVAEAVGAAGGPPVLFGSSLHVYGGGLRGAVGADRPYGEQGDLAHLSKVYGELVLRMHAGRAGFALGLARLGIVYGPSPVEHDRPESVTVVDKFRRLAAAGEPLPLDGGGRATIGVVHVEDAARVLLDGFEGPANVAAETITVADVAALAEGRSPAGGAAWTVESPFAYSHSVAEYLRR
ncbi:MAG TPA: SDR family oxidoreductase [Solirubrobacteraceae bacterium]|jgi:nucleoside-diphosphate-sugar epimerase|nr:SDR family oxidoreductase [Solirubrobacteraceae bacterium]